MHSNYNSWFKGWTARFIMLLFCCFAAGWLVQILKTWLVWRVRQWSSLSTRETQFPFPATAWRANSAAGWARMTSRKPERTASLPACQVRVCACARLALLSNSLKDSSRGGHFVLFLFTHCFKTKNLMNAICKNFCALFRNSLMFSVH